MSEISAVQSEGSEEWTPQAEDESQGPLTGSSRESPGQQEQLLHVAEVLNSIFEYYSALGKSGSIKEPRLSSTRFQRIATDAGIVDGRMTTAKVDLIYHRTCSGSLHMSPAQFRDAILRLAASKFPDLTAQDAVLRLYAEHLSNFHSETTDVVSSLEPEVVALLAAARPGLRALYEGYFGFQKRSTERRPTVLLGEVQGAFVKVLVDFEVLPDLAPKSTVHAVFREVSRLHDLPADLLVQLGEERSASGHGFTYAHFVVAIALMAQRCFADEEVSGIIRLFEWMDQSKGRHTFLATYPGRWSGGAATFRIVPERALRQQAAGLRKESLLCSPPSKAVGARRSSSESRKVAAVETSFSKLDVRSPPTGGSSFSGQRRTSHSVAEEAAAALPDWARRILQQIFLHYSALGDPLNRSSLSSLKFNRLLRDCGLIGSEVRGWHDGRTSLSSTSRSRGGSTVQAARKSVTAIAGSSPGLSCSGGSLPLNIFPRPVLSEVQADLIFVQALRTSTAETKSAGPRRRSASGPNAGTAVANPPRRHLGLDGLSRALAVVALRCMPGNFPSAAAALEELCSQLLVPLSDVLLEAMDADWADLAQCVSAPELQQLLQRTQVGLEKIFKHYAIEAPGQKLHWTADTIVRFAHDFDLTPELSILPLQRVFQDCLQHRGCSLGDQGKEMSFEGLQLALVMIAQKVHRNLEEALVEKVITLFHRLNGIAGASSSGVHFGPQHEPLIPIPRRHRASTVSAVAPRRRSNESSGILWTDMMSK